LGGNDHALAIGAIGSDAADGRDQENGDLAGEANRAQEQSRSGQTVDEPGLCNGLHPGADKRDELSPEK
jgi:hypothetical protein